MRFPRDVPRLSAGAVSLRAHRPEDAAGSLEQCLDPLSRRWTTVPLDYTRAHATRFVTETMPAGWEQDSEWGFAVEAPGPDGHPAYAGTVSLRNEGEGRAEVAYGAHPAFRGRGVMEAAVRLLLEWGFAERELRTVIWWANRGNWRSRRLAWRLGFTVTGEVAQWLPQRGELLDAWVATLRAGDTMRPAHPWLEAARLHGARVLLRPHEAADVPRVHEACADPTTAHWLGTLPRPYRREDAQAYVEGRAEPRARGTGVDWAVADPDTGRLLGTVSLLDLAGGEAELGYWAHPEARGRGLTTEACRLAVRHAFVAEGDGGLGLRRLRARAAEGNAASRRVLEACGFTEVGRERARERLGDGSYADTACYDLLLPEWEAAHGARSVAVP